MAQENQQRCPAFAKIVGVAIFGTFVAALLPLRFRSKVLASVVIVMACGLGIGCGSSKPPPSQQEIAVRQLLSDSNSRVWAKISNDGEYLTDKSLPGRLRFAVHGIRIRPTFLIPVANRTKWGGLEVVVSQIPALTELQVHRVPDFDDEALRRVGELQRLESLHIFGVPITDDGLRHISKLARLEELSFVSLTISGRGLSGLRHLKRLRLTRIRGDSMGGAAVSKLESLEELFVQGKSFNDDFVRHLTRLRLKKLVLSRCAITDDAIQSCVQIKTLEELSLPHSREITGSILPMLKSLPKLRSFSLYYSQLKLTDKEVTTLGKLTQLRNLRLDSVRISKKAMYRLRQALPDCEISAWDKHW